MGLVGTFLPGKYRVEHVLEGAMARLAGTTVLHVATHGFYIRASSTALAATTTTTVAQRPLQQQISRCRS